MKYCFFDGEGYELPVAYHLIREGREVVVGVIEDGKSDAFAVPHDETPEENKQRLSCYKGMLKTESHEDVLKMLRKVPKAERDDWFIFFGYSDLYPLAAEVLDMGFRNGLFPTEFYYEMEKDRNWAKEFVKEHYDRVRVAEDHEFQTAEEGIAFLEETEDVFVLKSNGSFGRTIVPRTSDPKLAKMIICDALIHYAQDYEHEGYILEKKIPDALEVTPIKVYYDGKPIYTLAEFENKEFGAGNIGIQKGGCQNLSVRTPMNCELNKIAFPPIIDELAAKQPGLAIYDAGLMYDGRDFWFTEFCAQRFGYDGIFAEIFMRSEGEHVVGPYFEDLVAGRSPILNRYGVAVRLFNLEGSQVETKAPKDDLPMVWAPSSERHLFLYRAKKKAGQIVSVGGYDLIGCMAGHSDVLETAVNKTYKHIEKIAFEKLYYRPKFDFLSRDYPSSILNRYDAMKPFISLREEKPEPAPEMSRKMAAIASSRLPEAEKQRFMNAMAPR